MVALSSLGACDRPAGPTGSADLTAWMAALRSEGATVASGDPLPASAYRFFSVPPQQIVVNGQPVSAFEYRAASDATADAARVSPDGQPSPNAIIEWVSTPRFYRRDRLIVLYVGCKTDVIQPLDRTLGTAFAVGRVPCS